MTEANTKEEISPSKSKLLVNSSLWIILGLSLCTLLYFISGPQSITDGDSGEFAVLAVYGGIAHPPGYPLYTFLLRLAHLTLPFELLTNLSILSMLCSLLAGLFIYKTLRSLNKSPLASTVGVVVSLLAAPCWKASTTIEPFALNLLLAAVLLWLSVSLLKNKHEQIQEQRRLFLALGVCFGFGFSNHHTLAFLAPGILLVMLTSLFQGKEKLRPFFFFAFGFCLGLLPILYLLSQVGASSPVSWGNWSNLGASLTQHLLRKDYGTLQLASQTSGSWLSSNMLFLSSLPKHLSYTFLLLLLLGLGNWLYRWVKGISDRTERLFLLSVFLHVLFTSFLFLGLSQMDGKGLGIVIIERFFALPILLMSPFLILGIQASLEYKADIRTKAKGFLLIYCLLHAGNQYLVSNRREQNIGGQFAQNVFSYIESNAVVFASTDPGYMSLLYERHVRQKSSNILIVQEGLWSLKWYRLQIQKELKGTSILPKSLIRFGASISKERPIYLSGNSALRGKMAPLKSYPLGPLFKLVAKGKVPTPKQQFLRNFKLFQTKFIEPSAAKVQSADPWESLYLMYYTNTWGLLWQKMKALKKPKEAKFCWSKVQHYKSKWVTQWLSE